jgi:hypothetical protein
MKSSEEIRREIERIQATAQFVNILCVGVACTALGVIIGMMI